MNRITYKLISSENAKEVRDFCLRIIKEVYRYDYRPDWHADLDSLLKNNGEYSANQKGAFFVSFNNEEIIGTTGIKSLSTKPLLLNKFKHYGNGKQVGSIWRTYVDKNYRGKGIGKKLTTLAENFAKENSYKTLYLHTSHQNPDAMTFWKNRGYKIIAEDPDQTVHMEKILTDFTKI